MNDRYKYDDDDDEEIDIDFKELLGRACGKCIKIETVNSEGEIGLSFEVILTNTKFEFNVDGCEVHLVIINGHLNLFFEEAVIEGDGLGQDYILLFRSGEPYAEITLPIGQTWKKLSQKGNANG